MPGRHTDNLVKRRTKLEMLRWMLEQIEKVEPLEKSNREKLLEQIDCLKSQIS